MNPQRESHQKSGYKREFLTQCEAHSAANDDKYEAEQITHQQDFLLAGACHTAPLRRALPCRCSGTRRDSLRISDTNSAHELLRSRQRIAAIATLISPVSIYADCLKRSGGYVVGSISQHGMPVASEMAITHWVGIFFHCDTACDEMPHIFANATVPPALEMVSLMSMAQNSKTILPLSQLKLSLIRKARLQILHI